MVVKAPWIGALLGVSMVLGGCRKSKVEDAAPSASTSAATAPSNSPAPGHATDEEIESAQKASLEQLGELSKRYPRDERIKLIQLRHEIDAKLYAASLQRVQEILDLDPKLHSHPDLADALFRAAQRDETADATFELLLGSPKKGARMGEKGSDIVFDLANAEKVRDRTKKRASAAMASPEFAALCSPGLKVLVDLKAARTCDERYRLLPRARTEGDDRALALLESYEQNKTGCGPKHDADCNPCMRNDTVLSTAIQSVKKRLGR